MTLRTFRLGEFRAVGDRFEFEAEPKLVFDARAGDEAEFVLAFRFEEASDLEETLDLTLDVTIEGVGAGHAAEHVADRPFVKDEARGVLVHVTKLPGAGEHKGRFKFSARLETAEWSGGGTPAETSLDRSGEFLVRVR